MKHSLFVLFFLVIFLFVFTACAQTNKCYTNEYTKDGKCCEWLCDAVCTVGYEPNTCRCACSSSAPTTTLVTNPNEDSGVNDLFDDNNDVQPPSLPS